MGVRLVLAETAREAVMAGRDPHQAVAKLLAGDGQGTSRVTVAGDVPPGGATSARKPKGSILDVVTPSRQIPASDALWGALIDAGDVVAPPYDPWALMATVEESDILPPLVDAMAVNVAGHGVDLEPQFKTHDPETRAPLPVPPKATAERAVVEQLLVTLNPELGVAGLIDRGVRDLEKTGNAYQEVLRSADGRVRALEHLPAYTMRLGKLSRPVLVDIPVRNPATGAIEVLPRWRRFRTYCQVVNGAATWFKQVGDPRYVNWRTGAVRDTSWGSDAQGNALDATEVRHLDLYSGYSEYGVPRWIGAAPHVRAGRSAGELVAAYFDSAPIGCKVAIIAGGAFSTASYERAISKIDEMARGSANAFSLVTLEAESGGPRDPLDDTKDAPARVLFEDLAWTLDAGLYQGSDSLIEGSSKRVRRTYRLPPLYTGDADDYSRASAETSREVAEEQVFGPARAPWERWFDELLAGEGITYWRIRLRAPKAAVLDGGVLKPIVDGGGLSPNALHERAAQLLGQAARPIVEPWGDRPLELTLALVAQGLDPNKPLAELAAEVAQREEAKAKEAADRLAAVGQAAGSGRSPQRDPVAKSLADEAGRAFEEVAGLADLQRRLLALARSEE